MGRRSRLRARHMITNTAAPGSAPPRANVRSRAREQLEAHGREGKPGQTWYRIANLVQAPGAACIYMYGEIGMWGIEAADFIRDLNQVNASTIELHINSMGGEVFEGIAILNALRAHRATVTTYVDGLAASIASVIAMAGERIVMGRNTTMMVHEASMFAIGTSADLHAQADMLDQQSDNIAAVYAEKAGGTVEAWREVMRAETWYLAEEAVAAGLADEVDTSGAPEREADPIEEMAATFDLSVFRYAGRENAPVPANIMPRNEAEDAVPAAPAEPVEAPGGEPAPEQPAAPPTEVTPVVEPDEPATDPASAEDPADPPHPDPVVPAPAAPTDEWAALFGPLTAAPSELDDVFAALWK